MKYLLIILLTLASVASSAQKSIQEWSKEDDKRFGKTHQYLNTLIHMKTSVKKGWLAADQIKPVKRVGILSFVLIQPTFTEKSGNSIYTDYLTETGTVSVMDKVGPAAIEGIKSGLAQQGMELLLPEAYCDTPEKKALFEKTEFELSTLWKATASIASHLRSHQTSDDPTGYYWKFISAANADIKVWRALGDFAGKMGVDALLTVEQTIYFDGKSVTMGPAILTLVGPNPTPKTDDTSYAPFGPLKGYLEGFIFGSVTVTPPALPMAEVKKKSVTFSDLSGLDACYSRIMVNLTNYMNKELEEIKK